MTRVAFILALAIGVFSCSDNNAPRETRLQEIESREIPSYPTTTELAAMLGAGETTSVALVSELLDRAERADTLHAYITVDRVGALARARELDEMRRAGELLGPLHGIPIVVKDNIHVAGLPNSAGTPALSEFIPARDNPTIEKLRAAGVIFLAKANMHELAFGITSDNSAYGAVANPFDTTTFAGGSSGGTAAAVSAGLASAGLGTDTGGSARIPAALTGVVGFRPSTGRYDSSGVTPISVTRDTVGVIARTAADVLLLDTIIAESEPEPERAEDAVKPAQIRLGVAKTYYYANLDAESAGVVDHALKKLTAAGVTLVDAEPGDIESLLARSAFPLALYEVERDLPTYLTTFDTGVSYSAVAAAAASPDVKGLFSMLEGDGPISDVAYADALVARGELRDCFRAYFAKHNLDAMIFPTTLLPSRPIKGSLETVVLNGEQVPTFPTYIHNTDPASIAALPGISLPVGLTRDGLPVGLELDGPEGSDTKLLRIAAALETIFDYSAQPGTAR